MNKTTGEPESILLKDLPKEYYRLQFLIDTANENVQREMEISKKAGVLVGILYDEILKQYHNPENPETLKSLNMLCVRLVFCLYAEDSGLFGGHAKFHDYLKSIADKDIKCASCFNRPFQGARYPRRNAVRNRPLYGRNARILSVCERRTICRRIY